MNNPPVFSPAFTRFLLNKLFELEKDDSVYVHGYEAAKNLLRDIKERHLSDSVIDSKENKFNKFTDLAATVIWYLSEQTRYNRYGGYDLNQMDVETFTKFKAHVVTVLEFLKDAPESQ